QFRRCFADHHTVGPRSLPTVEREPVGLEEAADFRGADAEHLIENRNENTAGVVTEDGASSDARELLVLRYRDREALPIVDMKHDVNVRAAVSHIDDPVRRHSKVPAELVDHGDLAVAGHHAGDGADLAGSGVILELRPVDMLGRHDALE